MTSSVVMDQFPEPTPTPRMYRLTTPDHREEDANWWMRFGACNSADPEAFFPEKGGSTLAAKKVCEGCDVRAQCLQYALDHEERFGLWGGKSERERRKMRATREAGHGTNVMYTQGCQDEATCPGNDKGTTCSRAHRNYENRLRRYNARVGAA